MTRDDDAVLLGNNLDGGVLLEDLGEQGCCILCAEMAEADEVRAGDATLLLSAHDIEVVLTAECRGGTTEEDRERLGRILLMRGMPEKTHAKILQEFTTIEQTERSNKIFQAIVRGRPQMDVVQEAAAATR